MLLMGLCYGCHDTFSLSGFSKRPPPPPFGINDWSSAGSVEDRASNGLTPKPHMRAMSVSLSPDDTPPNASDRMMVSHSPIRPVTCTDIIYPSMRAPSAEDRTPGNGGFSSDIKLRSPRNEQGRSRRHQQSPTSPSPSPDTSRYNRTQLQLTTGYVCIFPVAHIYTNFGAFWTQISLARYIILPLFASAGDAEHIGLRHFSTSLYKCK